MSLDPGATPPPGLVTPLGSPRGLGCIRGQSELGPGRRRVPGVLSPLLTSSDREEIRNHLRRTVVHLGGHQQRLTRSTARSLLQRADAEDSLLREAQLAHHRAQRRALDRTLMNVCTVYHQYHHGGIQSSKSKRETGTLMILFTT